MDYTELKKAIGDYLQNDESTFQQEIDGLIRTAERRVYSMVRTVDARASVSGTLAAASPTVNTPDSFQDSLQLIVTINGVLTNLLLKEPSFVTEVYSTSTPGPPRYYGILNSSEPYTSTCIVLGPTPDVEYSYELRFICTPPSIVDVNNTWLGDHAHPALLYQALVEGYTYMKGEPPLMELYRSRCGEAMDDLKRLCEGVQHMDTYRNPELRVSPV